MTLAADHLVNGVEQQRLLVTEIPGPISRGLLARKQNAVSAGIGVGLPVFITKAAGGVLIDVDGNSLIDMGSGIAVTTVGNANPEVVRGVQDQVANFTHTCFMVTPYEGYVQVCEALNRLTPGDHEKRSALLALFLTCGSGDNFLLRVVCVLCSPSMLVIIVVVSLTNNHFTLEIVSAVSQINKWPEYA